MAKALLSMSRHLLNLYISVCFEIIYNINITQRGSLFEVFNVLLGVFSSFYTLCRLLWIFMENYMHVILEAYGKRFGVLMIAWAA